MSAVERLALLITADGGGAIREFGKVGQAAERDLGGAESRADRLGSRMTSAGAVMMGASAVMVAGMWNAGQSAAALEQSVGGSEAVFKDSAAGIQDWAEGAASSVGLSEAAALSLTTKLGGALKGLGYDQQEAADQSKKLTEVAADLAATYGGTTADAVQALGAAFRGEFDPAEQFNLFLKQSTVDAKAVEMGLASSTAKVDAHARAQATLALIMEQSTDAQGQFARETDSTSGRLAIAQAEFENLKAQVGAGFTPVMATAGQVLGTVTGGLKAADDATGGLASQIVGIGSVSLGAVGGLAFLGGQAIKMRENLSNMADQFGRVGSAIPIVGVAAVVGVGIWQMYAQAQAEADQRAKDFIGTLDSQTGALTANTTAATRAKLEDANRVDNLNAAGVSLEQYTAALADNTEKTVSAYQVSSANSDAEASALMTKDEMIAKLHDEGGARNELLATLLEHGQADRGLVDQIYEESAAYEANKQAIEERTINQAISTGKTREQAEADRDAKAAADANTEAVKAHNDAVRAATDPYFAAFKAQEALNAAQSEAYLVSLSNAAGSQEVNDAQLKLVEAGLASAAAQRGLNAEISNGNAGIPKLQAVMEELRLQGIDPSSQAAQDLIANLYGVQLKAGENYPSPNVNVTSNVDSVIEKFNSLVYLLGRAGSQVEVRGPGVVANPGLPSFRSAAGRAAGGPVKPWSMYEVHDTASPELLETKAGNFLLTGASGGMVTNLGDSATVSGGVGGRGGDIHLHIGSFSSSARDGRELLGELLGVLKSNQGEVRRAIGL